MHPLDQQWSLQVSEFSSIDDSSNNQTESICRRSVIMQATTACLSVPLGIHIDVATKYIRVQRSGIDTIKYHT